MKKKIQVAVPLILGLILAFTAITVAWIVTDSQVRGLHVSSTTDGVVLRIRNASDIWSEPSETLDLQADLVLKPCVYSDGVFYDKDGNNVTTNQAYVKTYSIGIIPEQACTLYVTKSVEGNLPVCVLCNGVEVTESTNLGSASGQTTYTIKVFVDGNSFNGNADADTTITFHGE